jgi:hypothetical protein
MPDWRSNFGVNVGGQTSWARYGAKRQMPENGRTKARSGIAVWARLSRSSFRRDAVIPLIACSVFFAVVFRSEADDSAGYGPRNAESDHHHDR